MESKQWGEIIVIFLTAIQNYEIKNKLKKNLQEKIIDLNKGKFA